MQRLKNDRGIKQVESGIKVRKTMQKGNICKLRNFIFVTQTCERKRFVSFRSVVLGKSIAT